MDYFNYILYHFVFSTMLLGCLFGAIANFTDNRPMYKKYARVLGVVYTIGFGECLYMLIKLGLMG